MDSLPYFDSLADRYEEQACPNSELINKRIAQKIEQGIGRGVRGEKDYCAILIIGSELVGSTSVLNILRKYYAENRAAIKKSGYFFVNGRGNRYTEQSIRLMLKKYTAQAGIERNITPHMFRHSFATYLIEEGVDISCVQRILGHSSIKTTQIYIHVAARKQAEILRDMHPRNNMKIIGAA